MGEEKTKRTRKTPAERAQAELDIAVRSVQRLEDKAQRAKTLWDDTMDELHEAQDRLAYAKQNPALEGSTEYPDSDGGNSLYARTIIDDYADAMDAERDE